MYIVCIVGENYINNNIHTYRSRPAACIPLRCAIREQQKHVLAYIYGDFHPPRVGRTRARTRQRRRLPVILFCGKSVHYSFHPCVAGRASGGGWRWSTFPPRSSLCGQIDRMEIAVCSRERVFLFHYTEEMRLISISVLVAHSYSVQFQGCAGSAAATRQVG